MEFENKLNEILNEFTIPFTKKWHQEKRKNKKTNGWELYRPSDLKKKDKLIGKEYEYAFIYDNGKDLRVEIRVPYIESKDIKVVINDDIYMVDVKNANGYLKYMLEDVKKVIEKNTDLTLNINDLDMLDKSYQAMRQRYIDGMKSLNKRLSILR